MQIEDSKAQREPQAYTIIGVRLASTGWILRSYSASLSQIEDYLSRDEFRVAEWKLICCLNEDENSSHFTPEIYALMHGWVPNFLRWGFWYAPGESVPEYPSDRFQVNYSHVRSTLLKFDASDCGGIYRNKIKIHVWSKGRVRELILLNTLFDPLIKIVRFINDINLLKEPYFSALGPDCSYHFHVWNCHGHFVRFVAWKLIWKGPKSGQSKILFDLLSKRDKLVGSFLNLIAQILPDKNLKLKYANGNGFRPLEPGEQLPMSQRYEFENDDNLVCTYTMTKDADTYHKKLVKMLKTLVIPKAFDHLKH